MDWTCCSFRGGTSRHTVTVRIRAVSSRVQVARRASYAQVMCVVAYETVTLWGVKQQAGTESTPYM
jgi:hypothetical protein